MQEKILNILDLLSIVLGAFLGVVGTLTDTRTPNGKFRNWGRIVVAGIILTAMFSMAQSLLKQSKEREDKIAQNKKDTARLNEDIRRYRQQIALQDSVLRKVDTSLQHELVVQGKSDSLLAGVDKALKIGAKSLASSYDIDTGVRQNLVRENEVLLKTMSLDSGQKSLQIKENISFLKQQEISANTLRTLNPIFPFSLGFTLRIKVEETDKDELKKANAKVESIVDEMKSRHFYQLDGIEMVDDSVVAITTNFSKYATIEKYFIQPIYITIIDTTRSPNFSESKTFSFSEKLITKRSFRTASGRFTIAGDLVASVYPAKLPARQVFYMGERKVDREYQITYSKINKEYSVFIKETNVEIEADNGRFRSPGDLQGAKLTFWVFIPSFVAVSDIRLFFPPNYSRRLIFPSTEIKASDYFYFGRKEVVIPTF